MSHNYTVTIPVTTNYTAEDIDDLVYTAFDGIYYWVGDVIATGRMTTPIKGTYEALTHGGSILIRTDDSPQMYELTIAKLLKGIEMNSGYEPGQSDAYDCDNIIQYALFGELVYA